MGVAPLRLVLLFGRAGMLEQRRGEAGVGGVHGLDWGCSAGVAWGTETASAGGGKDLARGTLRRTVLYSTRR